MRTLEKADTLKDGLYKFPQTPSKIQFSSVALFPRFADATDRLASPSPHPDSLSLTSIHSVWPAGISTSSQGTIDWSGGLIDWTKATAQGFVAYVGWLNVQCYDPSLIPFQTSNSSANSSKSSRERSFDLLDERALLWERAETVNSYVYGSEFLAFSQVVRNQLPNIFTHSEQLCGPDHRVRIRRGDRHQLEIGRAHV